MKKMSFLAAALFCAFLLLPSFANAQTVLMNNFGYIYETGGFPSSNEGDILAGVGNVTSIDPSITCDLTLNELTWSIDDLVSLGQFSPDGGKTIIVSFENGVIKIHRDPAKNRDFGINPPNATAPSTFEDGDPFLLGSFTQFVMFYDTELQVGSFQGLVNFTTGTNLVDLPNPNGVIFAGTIGPNLDPNIPDGYSLEAVGRIIAPSLCTVKGNVSYVYDPSDCEACQGITRLILTYTGSEDISTATCSGGTLLEVSGNQIIITPSDGSKLPGNTTIAVGSDAVTIHTSCSRPLDAGNTIGSFTVNQVDKILVPCYEAQCDGISELDLLYNGINDLSTAAVSCGAYLQVVGDTIKVFPADGTLPDNITVSVGEDEAVINTSCSQPLEPGFVFGDFEVKAAQKVFPDIPDSGGIPTSGPVVGATVDLIDGQGNIFSTLTDENGDYIFFDVATGTISVSVVTPLGYVPLTPTDSTTVCIACDVIEVDFLFKLMATMDTPRTIGFWKHQVNSALSGKQKGVQVPADQLIGLFDQIHSRFDQYFNVFIPVVTLQDFSDVLSPKQKASMYDRARCQFAAVLLNVVSNRLATWQFVSEDNATASQAITYVSELLTDGDASNDELAKDISEALNTNVKVGSGIIPLSMVKIAYSPPAEFFQNDPAVNVPALVTNLENYPNPFNPSTTISYELTGELSVSLSIYNILGQRIRTLVSGEIQNGFNSVSWNGMDNAGSAVASGIYFCRLRAGNHVLTRRMVLVR